MTAHDTYTDTEARCICGQCIESEQHDQGCYQVGATVVRMYATDLSYQFRATWFDPDTDRAMSALVNRSASTGRWYVYPFGKTGTFGYLGAAVESLFPAPHDPSGRQCAIFGQDPQAPDACPGCKEDAK